MASEEHKKLQDLSDAYQKLQQDLQTLITARQRLESQHQENTSVAQEFASLASDANIYKLVGPVLVKQEPQEARDVVKGRLEFIGGEVKRIEGQIKGMQEEGEKRKMEVYELQSKMQQAQT